MSQTGNTNLRELLAKTSQRNKTAARWAFFAVHLFFAIMFTAIAWLLVITGNEALNSGAILITLLAFFGTLMHLRSALYDSGMYQQSASDALVKEIVRRGIDIETLLDESAREKPKRSAALSLDDDGELVSDVSSAEQSQPVTRATVQPSNARWK